MFFTPPAIEAPNVECVSFIENRYGSSLLDGTYQLEDPHSDQGFFSPSVTEGLTSALLSLEKTPYGFCFVDIGITAQDLDDFNQISLIEARDFNQFGEFSTLESGVADYLAKIGMSEPDIVQKVAARINQITGQIMKVSGEETAWICIRAFTPTDAYDMPRWHMDGRYYTPEEPKSMMYKFAMTLLGSPTLFYQLPEELRMTARKSMISRKLMQDFCHPDLILSPNQGEGTFFIGGQTSNSALHSEPPIHENRLFLSIIPCSEKELGQLKQKVLSYYDILNRNAAHQKTANY